MRDTAVPAEGNGDLQTLICIIVARPRRCSTLSNPVPWQNWMAAYLGYTLRMKMLFHGWPVMVHDTHTRRRRWSLWAENLSSVSTTLSLLCVLCLFRQVQASDDASLLYHELFFICSYSTSLLFIQSIIVSLCLPRYLFLPFCLLRLYAVGIHFSTRDLTNFSVLVGRCSSGFCFHPPCTKPLDCIGERLKFVLNIQLSHVR